jgi:hypothetical protein
LHLTFFKASVCTPFEWPLWSRLAVGPTQPPIQWIPGALSLGVKRPGREADHHLHLVPR